MPATSTLGKVADATVKTTGAVARTGVRGGRWLARNILTFRKRAAVGESGMMRLLDLHAASCAGDTLVTMGLAGTIFFAAPTGEARGRVALYLLVTMLPFALLAPVVGPVLDHFRHGRRWALAVTMFGRAILAWMISDYLNDFGLFPAAFGVLALSRSYGVARSAAVPRLLPRGLGLSEAGARASVFGTVAGLLVVPIGLLAFQIGPQWPLRTASVIFILGGIAALRLPGRTDSDPPERVPQLFKALFTLKFGRAANGDKVLHGRLVIASLVGASGLRGLYGFLLIFLAFTIKAGNMPSDFLGTSVGQGFSIALIAGALGAGTLLGTAIGSNLRVRRPSALQAISYALIFLLGGLCVFHFTLTTAALFCAGASLCSGLAKFAVDASIQERISEHVRASAFAHSETILMVAWLAGGALGLVPAPGRAGVVFAAVFAAAGAVRAAIVASVLRNDKLRGRVAGAAPDPAFLGGPPMVGAAPAGVGVVPAATPAHAPTQAISPESAAAATPPGFHLYRPTGADSPPDGDA